MGRAQGVTEARALTMKLLEGPASLFQVLVAAILKVTHVVRGARVVTVGEREQQPWRVYKREERRPKVHRNEKLTLRRVLLSHPTPFRSTFLNSFVVVVVALNVSLHSLVAPGAEVYDRNPRSQCTPKSSARAYQNIRKHALDTDHHPANVRVPTGSGGSDTP